MRTNRSSRTSRAAQRGFVLAYALAAIFVMSLLAGLAARMQGSGDNGSRMVELRDAILAQASLIQSKLMACAAMYPTSPNAIPFNAFPADASAYVKDLACPGAPVDVQPLWQSDDVVAAPVAPAGMSEWLYTRDASNVIRLSITSDSQSQAHVAALTNVARRFGANGQYSAGTLSIRLN